MECRYIFEGRCLLFDDSLAFRYTSTVCFFILVMLYVTWLRGDVGSLSVGVHDDTDIEIRLSLCEYFVASVSYLAQVWLW